MQQQQTTDPIPEIQLSKLAAKKNKILENFGGDNNQELFNILDNNIKYDHLRGNSLELFRKYISHKSAFKKKHYSSRPSMTKVCSDYAKEKIYENYKCRGVKSFTASLCYLPMSIIYLKHDDKDEILLALYITCAFILTIAEAREKLNIASINHNQEFLGRALIKSAKEVYESQPDNIFTKDAKSNIEKNLNSKNLYISLALIARYTSYISGPVVSIFSKSYSLANNLNRDSDFNKNFAYLMPCMPTINCFISYIASILRQEAIKKDFEKFESTIGILLDKNSYQDPLNFNLPTITKSFKQQMETPYFEDKGLLSKDSWNNPRKLVIAINSLGNYIRSLINCTTDIEDLTKKQIPEEYHMIPTPLSSISSEPSATDINITNKNQPEGGPRERAKSIEKTPTGSPPPSSKARFTSSTTLGSPSKDPRTKKTNAIIGI